MVRIPGKPGQAHYFWSGFQIKPAGMKQISYWALLNPVKAQIIITVCQTLLAFLGIYSGIWLFAQDVFVPEPVFYAGLTLFFTALALYPIRRARHKFWKFNYGKQKLMDTLLVLSFLPMVITVSNHDAHAVWRDAGGRGQAQPVMLKADRKMTVSDVQKKGWRFKELRKELKSRYRQNVSNVRQHAKAPMDDGGKVALVILLMIVLMAVVALLACAVACSGAEAGGVVIWVLGWAAVLILGVLWIRKIKGQRRGNYQPMKMHD